MNFYHKNTPSVCGGVHKTVKQANGVTFAVMPFALPQIAVKRRKGSIPSSERSEEKMPQNIQMPGAFGFAEHAFGLPRIEVRHCLFGKQESAGPYYDVNDINPSYDFRNTPAKPQDFLPAKRPP